MKVYTRTGEEKLLVTGSNMTTQSLRQPWKGKEKEEHLDEICRASKEKVGVESYHEVKKETGSLYKVTDYYYYL